MLNSLKTHELTANYQLGSPGWYDSLKRDEIFFVKNAFLIENFFDITKDYDRYIVANNVLEIVLKTNKTLEPNQLLFINTLKVLNLLAFEDIVEDKVVLLKFMLGTIKVNGFKLNFNGCSVCSLPFANKIYLNLENGSLECGNCKSEYSILVEKDVFEILKKINSKEITDLNNIDYQEKTLKNAIKLILLDIEARFNIKLNSQNYI